MRFQALLMSPVVQAIGWALLHFVWEGALLAALLLATDLAIARSHARLRYAVACMTMAAMFAVFVATIFRAALPPPPLDTVPRTAQGAAVVPSHSGTAVFDMPAWSPHPANALPGWLVCLWLAGVTVLSIYTAAGWMRVRSLSRRSVSPLGAEWNSTLRILMNELRVSRPVQFYASAIAEVPAVIGWLRPRILIPVAALTGLSESQLRAILAHELAHIRRHDYLVNMLQAAVETLLFYHPAVWWVSRRIRDEREHCCDDLAVSVCGDVMVYAGALAQLEELRGDIPAPGVAATGGDLLSRIRRLLGQEAPGRISVPAGAAIAAAMLLAAAISIAAAQQPTPKFEVASVKPCDPRTMQPGARSGPINATAGRLSMECLTVRSLIMMAYVNFAPGPRRMAAFELTPVEGGPEWINSERYTIDAKADSPASQDTMRGPMLRALLEDRFKVKTHRETREIPIYELTVAKSGFKLQPAAEGSCTPRDPTNPRRALSPGEKPYCGQASFVPKGLDLTADLRSLTLQDFADWLLLGLDRPVYDKTGLAGKYDFRLEYAADERMVWYRLAKPEDGPASFPSLSSVLQRFGLSLQPAKGPGQFLTIDQVERPSAN